MQKTQEKTSVQYEILMKHRTRAVDKLFEAIKTQEGLVLSVTREMVADLYDGGLNDDEIIEAVADLDDIKRQELREAEEDARLAKEAAEAEEFARLEAEEEANMLAEIKDDLKSLQLPEVPTVQSVSPVVELIATPPRASRRPEKGSSEDNERQRVGRFLDTFISKGWGYQELENRLVTLKDEQVVDQVLLDAPGLKRFCEYIGVEPSMYNLKVSEKHLLRTWVEYCFTLKQFVLSMDESRLRYCYARDGIHIYMPTKLKYIRKQLEDNNMIKVFPNAATFFEKWNGTVKTVPLTLTDFDKLRKKYELSEFIEEDGAIVSMADANIRLGRIFTIFVEKEDEGKELCFLAITKANKDRAYNLFQEIKKSTSIDSLKVVPGDRYIFNK